MKNLFIFSVIMSLVGFAYFSAQSKIKRTIHTQDLHLGMTIEQLEKAFGNPSAKNRNKITYIFEDSSELIITLRDEVVSSAQLKFHHPIKIEDPKMRQLSLVQMEANGADSHPSWFFAGKPEDGLIYKITSGGVIESLTWVPPFTYGNNQPKQLQALLHDFQSQQYSKM